MMFWMVSTCPDGSMFKIWLKSDEFEGIKNSLKDGMTIPELIRILMFLTGAGVLDDILDGLHMP